MIVHGDVRREINKTLNLPHVDQNLGLCPDSTVMIILCGGASPTAAIQGDEGRTV